MHAHAGVTVGISRHGLAATQRDGPADTDRRVYETLPEHLCLRNGDTPMSAAEPADPTPPTTMNNQSGAAVIDISTRINKPATGRGKHMSNPQPERPAGQSPQQQLADHFETTFNHHHLTLTDEATATAYKVTLEIVRGMLQGAEVQGIVDGEQRAELDAMIKGMAAAPRLV